MRVSLESDPAEFVKQVADLRRFINRSEAMGGQAALTARFLTASYVPFLAALRTELRGEIEPKEMLVAVSDLMANLAMTLIQSMLDAPPEAQAEVLGELLARARDNAAKTIENDARMARDAAVKAKPKLSILNGGKA